MTHREVEKISYDPETGMHTQDPPKHGDSVIAEDGNKYIINIHR